MASCRLVGVATVAISPLAPGMALCTALEDIAEGVACASLCLGASEKSVTHYDRVQNNKHSHWLSFPLSSIWAPRPITTRCAWGFGVALAPPPRKL